MGFYAYQDIVPVVDPSSYIHEDATVIGEVRIAPSVFVGAQAVIRGDFGFIDIREGANIQETCVVHCFPGKSVIIEKNAHIGHGAIIHGAYIGENAMVGMNAVIMDDARIGKDSIVGTLSFVKEGLVIGDGRLAYGNPVRDIRALREDEIAWKSQGTRVYQDLATAKEFRPCSPRSADNSLSTRILKYQHKTKKTSE